MNAHRHLNFLWLSTSLGIGWIIHLVGSLLKSGMRFHSSRSRPWSCAVLPIGPGGPPGPISHSVNAAARGRRLPINGRFRQLSVGRESHGSGLLGRVAGIAAAQSARLRSRDR